MSDYKILSYSEDLIDSYQEPIMRTDGLYRNPKEIIRTVEFYSVDQFLSGEKDELGRDKPFINHGNSRVRVAKTATDIDVKDIRYEPDSLEYRIQAMLINHELYKYLKESNFSLTLNEMGLTRPKYGHLLVKKCYDEKGTMRIEVVDWVNTDFNPSNILENPIAETHWMQPSELMKKADVWNQYDDIREVIAAHAKAHKNKPAPIEVKEITGEFSYSYDPDLDDDVDNDMKFKTMCFYIACVNKKKYLLYKEDVKSLKDKYRGLAWEKIGDGFGRGVWEEGFQSQMWINDQYIQMKNALDLSGKVFTKGTVKGLGNAIVGVDNGHHFELKTANDTLEAFQLSTAALPQFENLINLFSNEYNRISSTFDANTGEQPPSGTPLGQTQILNQVANSPFQYQSEVWGIWLNELMNDWIYPEVRRRILKDHDLVDDFSDDELDMIDEVIATKSVNSELAEMMFNREPVTPELQAGMTESALQSLKKTGKKRQIKIPKGFLDVEGKLTANITGELKNKQAILQSLDSVFKTVVSSFNPNTGTYAALEDPTLKKVFAQIVEMSGIPFSSAQLSGGNTPTSMNAQATTVPAMAQ